jgi:hypothetical protein
MRLNFAGRVPVDQTKSGFPFSNVPSNSDAGRPTPQTYSEWQVALDYFSERLFDGQLPDCIITLTRRKNAGGYFKRRAFENVSGAIVHEIAMNPAYLQAFGDRFALSVLVHEACHLWREEFGPRNKGGLAGARGYHDNVWATKMDEVGLAPSASGKPGGARTGYRMSHYIVDGGQFDLDCAELLATGFAINWHDHNPGLLPETPPDDDGSNEPQPKSRNGTRYRYTCPNCGLNAWAKYEARIACVDCSAPMPSSEPGPTIPE